MISPTATTRTRGLSAGHFRKIATNGFGDGGNGYSWGCTWYKDHLYIGVNRLVLQIFKTRIGNNIDCEAWPVGMNEKGVEIDRRGQVWRYSLDTNTWERVFLSPMMTGIKNNQVPMACGFRHLTLFQGKSDPHPVIYTIPGCGFDNVGPTLLRCEDGTNFVPSSKPGLGMADPDLIAYRGAVSFKGKLFISPAGYRGGHVNIAYGAPVFCSDDPVAGKWEASNIPSFGDATNHGIFDIGKCGNYLYAGTINIRGGAQLWKTDGEGPTPHRWTKVFDSGADRGPFNQGIYCFAEFNGALYLGTAVQNGGNDRENNIGPAAGEVIRVYPDDSWDVVMGEPRLTPRGLRLPTSGMGAGFDNPFNGYIWRMCAHDGALYVGTFDAMGFFGFSRRQEWPKHVQRLLDTDMLEMLFERRGGCELWRTLDGDNWSPVTLNGFGNPFNWGVRAMVSTPRGLFVGTANPFGPDVATRDPSGWHYEYNNRGGLEVWHGAPENAGCGDLDAGTLGLPEMDFMLEGVSPGITLPSFEQYVEGSEEADALVFEPVAPAASDETPTRSSVFDAGPPTHDIVAFQVREEEVWRRGPTHRLNEMEKDLQGLSESIDDELSIYFGGPMQNAGYWTLKTATPRQACERLLDELLRFLPKDSAENGQSMLILGPQAEILRAAVLERRPATQVEEFIGPLGVTNGWFRRKWRFPFDTSRFDSVLWIEGPRRPDSIPVFVEIRRVLKPAGCFLATTLVGDTIEEAEQRALTAETGSVVEEFRKRLEQREFANPLICDMTEKGWVQFVRHSREYFANKRLFQQIDNDRHAELLEALPGGRRAIEACLMIVAGEWNGKNPSVEGMETKVNAQPSSTTK